MTEPTLVDLESQLVQAHAECRRLSAALAQSDDRLRTFIEHAPEAVVILDVDQGYFIDANSRAEQLFGLSRDELLSSGPIHLSPELQPDGRPSKVLVEEMLDAALRGETPRFNWWHKNSAGETLPCEIQLVYLPAEGRRLVRGSVTDLRLCEEAAAKLQQAHQELRRVVASVSDFVWSASLDRLGAFKYRFISPVVERLTGHKDEYFEPAPMKWLGLIHPEDRPRLNKALESIVQRQAPRLEEEYRIIRADGEVRWVRDSVLVREGAEGSLLLDGVVSDITERKNAADELLHAHQELDDRVRERTADLMASEERFRQLAENIAQVFWITSPDKGKMVYVSPAYEVIFGRTCESLYAEPRSFIDAIHSDDRQRFIDALPKQALGTFDEEYRIIRPDGAQRWLRARGFPVFNARGEVYRIAGLTEDITLRKAAEEKLRESAELHRTLLDRHVDGVALVLDGRFIYANPSVAGITGYTLEELVGRAPYDLVCAADRDRARRRIAELLAGAAEEVGEYEGVRKDGAEYRLEVRSRAIRYRGRPALLSFFRDVTTQRLAEEKVRFLARIVRHADAAIIGTDLQGNILSWNPAAERMFGYAAEEALGQTVDLVIPPERKSELSSAIERIRSGEAVHSFVSERMHRSGRRIDVALTISSILDSADCVVGASAIVRDITEQVRTEQARRRSEEKWHSLVSTAPGLILILDRDGTINYINDVVPGFDIESVTGTSAYGFVKEDYHELMRSCIEEVWQTGEKRTIELIGRGAGGSWRWYESRHGTLRQDGEIIGVTVISTDITERKLAEERLIVEDRMLRELLEQRERERDLIVHEVHDGFIQDIVGAQLSLQALIHAAHSDQRETTRTLECIDRLLKKAIDEGRRLIYELGPLILEHTGLVVAIDELMRDEVADGRLTVELAAEIDDDSLEPLLKGTVFRIVQEALTNVRRHSQATRATVTLGQTDRQLHVEIEDNGVGFDPALVRQQSFGLHGIRQRARMFGGCARVDSVSGRGTKILVEFPLRSEATMPNDSHSQSGAEDTEVESDDD